MIYLRLYNLVVVRLDLDLGFKIFNLEFYLFFRICFCDKAKLGMGRYCKKGCLGEMVKAQKYTYSFF